MDKGHQKHLFTEVFPIQITALPKLSAYILDTGGRETSSIGGKLSYCLRRTFGGHWVWTSNRIVTDHPQRVDEIMRVVEELWHEQPEVFSHLHQVSQDLSWQPTPQAQADFVARGLFADIDSEIRSILSGKTPYPGDVYIKRVYDRRGWVVQRKPAVSLSISSRLIYKQDLKAYATRISSPEALIGMWVADKTSDLKGEIIQIAGRVAKHRKRLLVLTAREEIQSIIENASDNELVAVVLAGRNEYHYVLSALQLIVRIEDFSRLHINPQQILKILRIEPSLRAQLVKGISNLAKQRNLLINAYSSKTSSELFITATDVEFNPYLRFGENQAYSYEEKTLLKNLRKHGLYKRSERFQTHTPIRIGIINALDSQSPRALCHNCKAN